MKLSAQLSAAIILLAAPLVTAASEPATVSKANRHVRVVPSRSHKATIVLKWELTDSGTPVENRLRVELPPLSESDHLTLSQGKYMLTRRSNGQDSIIYNGIVEADYNKGSNAFSIVLKHNAAGTLVEMGSAHATASLSLPADGDMTVAPAVESFSGCEIIRNDSIISYLRPREFAPFSGIEDLKEYLRRSTDVHEGIWTYLDRDMDHRLASLGGSYTLATVATPEGYDIVYLGGAPDGSRWQPMMIKGRMRTTLFMHHFDLDWTDIDGNTAGNEASASVSDGAILSLSFPLLKTSVRFRKIPVDEI